MKEIDEYRLETDTVYRFTYVSGFIGLGAEDIQAIHDAAPLISPLMSIIVDAVYEKLFAYDCTKRHFVPRQSGYEGDTPIDIDDSQPMDRLGGLTLDHPQVVFRKEHLAIYLTNLLTHDYDEELIKYLDHVGEIHTTKTGNSIIHVPLVQMNALLGYVSVALTDIILSLSIPHEDRRTTLLAFTKLLWIQNDLISKHY
jgi:hypothetical protein